MCKSCGQAVTTAVADLIHAWTKSCRDICRVPLYGRMQTSLAGANAEQVSKLMYLFSRATNARGGCLHVCCHGLKRYVPHSTASVIRWYEHWHAMYCRDSHTLQVVSLGPIWDAEQQPSLQPSITSDQAN